MVDLIAILISLIKSFWYVIPIFILIGYLNSPGFKGKAGEDKVNRMLMRHLPTDQYTLIRNVTLPIDGGTTQIDHIVLSRYGVFVVETKNMKGWIFGSPNQKQWTQKIFKHTNKFQNPLRQNYKHVKAIENLLGIELDIIFSVVVFIGDSEFKTLMPENVTHSKECIQYIKSKHQEVLSETQVYQLVDKLNLSMLKPGFKTDREHIGHVKTIIQNKKNIRIEPTINVAKHKNCPRCGATMVIKESSSGAFAGKQFWGCSTFPKCRAIVKIN